MKLLNVIPFTLLLLGQVFTSNGSNQLEILASYQKSTPSDPYYIAGVVEFQPHPKRNVSDQLEGYKKIIESDDAKPVDIIIFPEATFNTLNSLVYVPNPKDNVALCDNSDIDSSTSSPTFSPLQQISCLARKVQKYILINVSEKENCTTESQKQLNDSRLCAADGLNKYNTNVVFDRNGIIISRYRKWNLYSEAGTNTTVKPEYATFETDFGVTFGHFTCFDILFYTPTQELVERGVKDFLFPTMWFSELPFLTAVQQQRAWAYANDVNLLAAGASNPLVGSTGTGVYAGKQGSLIEIMCSSSERKIYVAKVPKKYFSNTSVITSSFSETTITSDVTTQQKRNNKYRLKGLKLLRDNINNYNTTLLNWTHLEANKTICSKNLCCEFYVKWTTVLNTTNFASQGIPDSLRSYKYVLAAYEGERTYQNRDSSHMRTCALLACTNHNISSCGTVFPDDVNVTNQFIFNEIQIQGNFITYSNSKIKNNNNSKNDNGKSLIMPSNLDEAILPLPVNQFSFEITTTNTTNKISQIVKCHLKTIPKSNLLTFGIYVNDFKLPSEPDDCKDSSSLMSFSINTIINSLLLIEVCKHILK